MPRRSWCERRSVAALVAVTGTRLEVGRVTGWHRPAFAAPGPYLDALSRAGASCVVVPAVGDPSTELLERVDGLVLTGGGDVDPALYGAVAAPETAGIDAVRDRHEIALARAAVERGLPLLAICRGQQVLNVALGGTLRQHIEGHAGTHDKPLDNQITVDGGTRLAHACRDGVIAACACRHHQAIDDVAPGLTVVGPRRTGRSKGSSTRATPGSSGFSGTPRPRRRRPPTSSRSSTRSLLPPRWFLDRAVK